MCGLAGYVGISARYGWDVLRRMADAQAHRGPDGAGFLAEGLVGLAHRRRAADDRTDGRQPLVSADYRYALVYDGAVTNFRELREDLTDLGYDFDTDSDAEVVFAAYQEWGSGAFARLDGVFALAVSDAETGEVILARDRAGVRPLFFAEDGDGRVAFASEIRAVVASGILRRPAELAVVDVNRLLPGQLAVINRDGQVRRIRHDLGEGRAVLAIRSCARSAPG
jgi:asparagine synthase (glutamine-hydrolysing)